MVCIIINIYKLFNLIKKKSLNLLHYWESDKNVKYCIASRGLYYKHITDVIYERRSRTNVRD
jgi:hypothetical protein